MIVVITGSREGIAQQHPSIILVGYLKCVDYVMLMLSSDAVLLPYPPSAICGGVRNKVLEAGYAEKLVIATEMGMVFTTARPWREYIPLEEIATGDSSITAINIMENNLNKLIKEKYTFDNLPKVF